MKENKKIEMLDWENLLHQDEYSNWGSNKRIEQNIVDKLNEVINFLNNNKDE